MIFSLGTFHGYRQSMSFSLHEYRTINMKTAVLAVFHMRQLKNFGFIFHCSLHTSNVSEISRQSCLSARVSHVLSFQIYIFPFRWPTAWCFTASSRRRGSHSFYLYSYCMSHVSLIFLHYAESSNLFHLSQLCTSHRPTTWCFIPPLGQIGHFPPS